MNEKKPITLESWLYLLALGLALLVRLVGLNWLPFNENEAHWAWQAFQVSHGQAGQIDSHPAYVLLTAVLFYLLPSGEALARFVPAVVGAAVVALPYALRDKLGQKAALVAAFGLAIDPVSVAAARMTGSPAMAVGFAALALAAWYGRKPVWTGVFAGLYLLSGPSAWFGLLAALFAWALLMVMGMSSSQISIDRQEARQALSAAGLTLLVVGTLFLRYPLGLSAMMQAIPDYLRGWFGAAAGSEAAPTAYLLVSLALYQPLGLIFGVLSMLKRQTWSQGSSAYIAWFLLAALTLSVAYPSRQVVDMAWVFLPLWLLAGQQIAGYLRKPEPDMLRVVAGQSVLTLVLLVYWWQNLGKMTLIYNVYFPPEFKGFNLNILDSISRSYLAHIVILVLVPLLVLLLMAVIKYGWPGDAGYQGAAWGVGAFLAVYVFASMWGFSDARQQVAGELWMRPPAPGYGDDLRQGVREISEFVTGDRTQAVVAYQLDSDLLRWLLRDMPNAQYTNVISPGDLPEIILNTSPSFADPFYQTSYQGEAFVLQLHRDWGENLFPSDLDRWLVFREAPVSKQWLILWVRADSLPTYEPEGVE